MAEITFDQLPQAVTQLFSKLENIEKLLTDRIGQPSQAADQWLSIAELCEYLPDKPVKPTVYGWVHNKVIPYNKQGKSLYFLKSDIDQWLKSGRKKTYAETAGEAADYVSSKRK